MRMLNVIIMIVGCFLSGTLLASPPVTDGMVIHLNAREFNLFSGSAVSLWPDMSGAGNDATQDVADSQPVYIANSENFDGRAAVRFDGINDWMPLPNPAPFSVGSVTAIALAKFNALQTSSNQYIFGGQAPSSDADRIRVAYYTAANEYEYRIGNSGHKAITGSADTNIHVFAITSTAEGFLDGVSLGTSANTSTQVPTAFNIGSSAGGTKAYLNGEIAELIVYNRVLTAQEIQAVTNYMLGSFPPNTSPAKGEIQVSKDANLSWDTPNVTFTPSKYSLAIRAEDPNFLDTANNTYVESIVDIDPDALRVEAAMPISLVYGKTYYWRVDTYDQSTQYTGTKQSFTVEPENRAPIADAGSNIITWQDNLPLAISGSIDDFGENDISDADVQWAVISYPGKPVASSMQLLYRNINLEAAATQNEAGFDPNMLCDFIGTDINYAGNPLTISLSGLPSGSYTWTSVHHDLHSQTGTFDVLVDGSLVDSAVDISLAEEPVTLYTTSIVSDGVNPVKITFDQNTSDINQERFFVMNAFELSDGINTLKVDFTRISDPQAYAAPGYDSYLASHEVPESFTAQSFTLGANTVTVLPEWGPLAAGYNSTLDIVKTSTELLNPVAEFTTDYPGEYTIELIATDSAGKMSSDTMTVIIATDACEAAQYAGSWTGFNSYDFDKNCIVDLNDFASFSANWLNDLSARENATY